ncbi:hypothetical protein [Agromyces sp. NPDC057865]|uniref:hypothetical protein n=1 Tax=Agromyces sp. NPDC057865 TaxID=3346267 RepID=UPI00366FA557
MRTVSPGSPLVSGELQVFRWVRRRSESLSFSWLPGRETNPLLDGFVGVVGFSDQPKLGPAVLYDCPIESALTTSVTQFKRNSSPWLVRLGSRRSEELHDQSWFRRPRMNPPELEAALARLKADPPPGTFFDEYWTRAQLENREWYSVHGLARTGDGLREVIVLCSCSDDLPTMCARAALTQVEDELGYDFEVSEVYRTHAVGPAVSGIGALHIQRRID